MRCSNEQHLTMVLMLLLTVQPTGSSTQQGSEDARGHQDVHELRRTQELCDTMLANTNNLQHVQQMLVSGVVHADCVGRNGQTALLLAAHDGNYDLAWLLLEAPYASAMVRPQAPSMTASQKTAGHDGTTPAPSAPKTPKTLRANANIASRQPMDEGSAEGDTPLHHAARTGSHAIVDMLLKHGADINARNSGGQTATHSAAASGVDLVLAALIEHGADANVLDDGGMSPAHIAAQHSGYELLALLQDNGADLTLRDKHKRSIADMVRVNSLDPQRGAISRMYAQARQAQQPVRGLVV